MRIENKQTLLIGIAIVLAISFFGWMVLQSTGVVESPGITIDRLVGTSYKVKHIGVISGHEFDLKLEDGRRVHALLDVKTAPEAKEHVVRVLNNARSPRIRLIEKNGSDWRVELYVKIDGQEVNFVSWLRQMDLVWE